MQTPNYFLNFLPNYSGTDLSSEFRFYEYKPQTGTVNTTTGLDNFQVQELQTAKTKALIGGDGFTVKLIENVLKFGVPALLALSQAGVIKNKNIVALSQLTADKDGLNSLLARTGGNLDPNSVLNASQNTARSTETNILGVPVTYIIVSGIGLILYMLFKEPSTKTKSK
jgi:hypothetical protein